jgi:hypothetical protein
MGKMKEMDILLYRVAANHDPILDLRLVGSLNLSAPLNDSSSYGKKGSDPSLSLPSPKSDEACDISNSSNNSVRTPLPSEHGGLIPDSEQGFCGVCEFLIALAVDQGEEIDEVYCEECGRK